jgi:hypothetical protein
MILRRLSESLKQQNWTAIWIEFVLLVTGVFLGIQVSNWNQERELAKKAALFTERLRDDLRVEVWRFEALNLYYRDVAGNAGRTLADLEGRERLPNEALVIAAYRATQYSEFIQYRATYDELVSTGAIGLITDQKLRRMANEVFSTALYANVKNEGLNSPYRVAFRKLLPLRVQFAVTNQCGDKPSELLDYKSIERPLDYPCKSGLTAQEIDAAAAALRADPGLPALLRLRVTNIYSAVGVWVMSEDTVDGMRVMREQAMTPAERAALKARPGAAR